MGNCSEHIVIDPMCVNCMTVGNAIYAKRHKTNCSEHVVIDPMCVNCMTVGNAIYAKRHKTNC